MTLGCIARCLKIIEKGLIQHYETCGQAVLLDRSLLKDTKKPVDNPKMKKKLNETFFGNFQPMCYRTSSRSCFSVDVYIGSERAERIVGWGNEEQSFV